MLLAGRITGPNEFEPMCSLLVQNGDEVSIPLTLFLVPSARTFKDAVQSLSPEQQRFAKAIRSMQLESTLFGVCVIHVRPQLERVLNLPEDALAKDVFLTQDLLTLFVKYQIPSDLLSYTGRRDVAIAAKVSAVRKCAASVMAIVRASEEQQLEEARRAQELRRIEEETRRLEEESRRAAAASPPPVSPRPSPRMLQLTRPAEVKPAKEGELSLNGVITLTRPAASRLTRGQGRAFTASSTGARCPSRRRRCVAFVKALLVYGVVLFV